MLSTLAGGVEMMSLHHRALESEVAVADAFDAAQRYLSAATRPAAS